MAKRDKIEDFGAVLPGARKNYAFEYGEQAARGAGDSLNEIWPAPKWEKLIEGGADARVVGFMRALREQVKRRPTGRYAVQWGRVDRWREEVIEKRDLALTCLSEGRERLDALMDEMKVAFGIGGDNLYGMTHAYAKLGHGRSLRNFKFSRRRVMFDENTQKRVEPRTEWFVSRRRVWCVVSDVSLDEAVRKLGAKIAEVDKGKKQQKKSKPVPFKIYRYGSFGDNWYIGIKVGPIGSGERGYGRLELRSFKDSGEARQYLNKHYEELAEEYRNWRKVPTHRLADNQPRSGPARRSGPATPEMFMETFAPRGVQFGNYVNAKERQTALDQAYDALIDLAEVLDVPPKALFLDGTLGLAFGARGRGGPRAAMAHYEPSPFNTINLTKPHGAGCLAHEWFHAFDYWAAEQRFGIGRAKTLSAAAVDGLYVGAAGTAFRDKVIGSPMLKRAKNLDLRRTKPYWAKPLEVTARSFEVYVRTRSEELGLDNDFLVNYKPFETWRGGLEWRGKAQRHEYPYLLDEEIPAVMEAFPALLADNLGNLCAALEAEDEAEQMHAALAPAA